MVTFGTPYYGSLNAVDFLVNGFDRSWAAPLSDVFAVAAPDELTEP